jgi:hypothetical protein
LMFATELGLFSIGTIVVLTSNWWYQHIQLTTSTNLDLVEQVYVHVETIYVLLVPFNIHVELVFVLPV